MSATISASGLELAEACVGSASLAQVRRPSDAYQTKGTAIHAYLEAALAGDPRALASVPDEHKAVCQGIDLAALFPPGSRILTEVPLAYDVASDSTRVLARGAHRSYAGLREGEVPGTVDVIETWGEPVERATVHDFKSGWLRVESDSFQLAVYGLMVARLFGLDEVAVRIIQLDESGGSRLDERTLGAWDLLTTAGRVGGIVGRVWKAQASVENAEKLAAEIGRLLDEGKHDEALVYAQALARLQPPNVATGEHCGFCNVSACPGRILAAREYNDAIQRSGNWLPALSDEEFGVMISKMLVAKPLWEEMNDGVRAEMIRRKSVPLPDGRTFESRDVVRRSFDAKRSLPVLQAFFGEGANDLFEQKLSVEAIERVAGDKADEVMNALDAAGALRTKATPTQRAYGKARVAG